MLLEQNFT